MEDKRQNWNIRNMPEWAVREIKAQAARENRQISEVLTDAIRKYINAGE